MKFILIVLFFAPDLSAYKDLVDEAVDTLQECEDKKKQVLAHFSPVYAGGFVFAQCVQPRPVSGTGV